MYIAIPDSFMSADYPAPMQDDTFINGLNSLINTPIVSYESSEPTSTITIPVTIKHEPPDTASSYSDTSNEYDIQMKTIPAKPKPKRKAINNYNCDYLKLAKEFISSLDWNDKLFDSTFDKCYCPKCYSTKLPDVTQAGEGEYVIPREWARIGLRVDEAFQEEQDIWNRWIVTFHGTTIIAAKSILSHRHFCLPGDTLIDGSVLGIRKGHIPGKQQIYTSPTIAYSSLPGYSPKYEYYSTKTRRIYDVQIVLQCRQKLDALGIQGETVGAGSKRLCQFIPNDRIEYFTKARAALVPYGLLVRLV
ncbi:unnamed protein product [Rotaria socialis]|uniref:Uncharacterized protein n=1 Tax=Rotaria socialis TaxID=392032 RepID=A0A820SFQ5_9BILA|nr:unnamed protein product [Rotaria socialis]CAF4555970.1 unnamed protein product [Rotaria socialis]CAF4652618.1 unnamed protein product [Rotaria socialis]CAF4812484.1 unnamed protein product [Rotaria socialis]